MAINIVYAESELQQSAASIVYQVPSLKKYAVIEAVTVVNNGADDQSHSVWLIPKTTNPVAANRYIKDKAVAAGSTIVDSEIVGQSLNSDDTIQCQANADAAISIRFTIKEVV